MKVAVIGSRGLKVAELEKFLPQEISEVVSGGARGVDTSAKHYAFAHNLKYKEFLPDYEAHGRKAPILRNIEIIEYADIVLAFWDGSSKGTEFVINKCKSNGVPVRVFMKKSI